MGTRPDIYIVDDAAEIREMVRGLAEDMDLRPYCAESGRQFFAQYRGGGPAIIWLDIVMPGQDGLEIMASLAKAGCREPIVLSTGHTELYTDLATKLAEEQGLDIVGVVHKPFAIEEVKRTLTDAAAHAAARARERGAASGTGNPARH